MTAETLNSVPGGSVRAVARAGYVSAGGEALKVAALVGLAVAVLLKGAPHIAIVLACLAIAGVRGARRSFRMGQRFARGAASEEVVGAQLEALEGSRWVVEHDLVKPGGGNIDHVVHSASRTFVIDTKRSQWRAKDIAQACRHADWAARHFGSRRLIVPVICIERSDQRPMLIDGIWVVGRPHLVVLIEEEG